MNTKYFLLLILWIFSSSIFAQNKYLSATDSDKDAIDIINKSKSKLKDTKSLIFDYSFISRQPDSEPVITNGKGMQKGEKYFIEMGDKNLYCDGNSLIVYFNTMNEAQINDMPEESNQMTPSGVLNSFDPEEYIFVLAPDKKEKGKSYYNIILKPQDKYSEYAKIELLIDKNSLLPHKVIMIMKDGTKNILEINSIKMNQDINNNVFIFNKAEHPGVSVEDLRMN